MVQNKSLIFKKVPTSVPVAGEHLTIEDRPIDLDTKLPENGLLVQSCFFSFDPYQRGRMRSPEVKSYSPPYTLDKPINNSSIAKVVKSANPKFSEGDTVIIYMSAPFQEYNILEGNHVQQAVWKLDNPLGLDPINFLGPLGMPGLTAYSSFYEIGEPKKGETIFISAASGAVGQIVGQLAKREGLKVIGSVGDQKKLDYIVNELGFDGAFNYKEEDPAAALKRLAPDGIDIYYENVGGPQLAAAIDAMKWYGRIIACGMISDYNSAEKYPIRNLMQFIAKRLKMQGFIVSDFQKKYSEEHQKNVQQWIKDGSLKPTFSITEGMDNAIEGLLSLFSGKNFGKAVLQVAKL